MAKDESVIMADDIGGATPKPTLELKVTRVEWAAITTRAHELIEADTKGELNTGTALYDAIVAILGIEREKLTGHVLGVQLVDIPNRLVAVSQHD